MSKRLLKYPKRDRDLYPTPMASVRPLIPHLRAEGIRRFCEPCAGDGDLVRHLEACGLTCVYQGDIATGQDALAVARFDATVITNLPFSKESKPVMMALLRHFLATAPRLWLLWPADFAHHDYLKPYMAQCTTLVRAGRACWFGGSGFDYVTWFRFDPNHGAGPVFVNGDPRGSMACQQCGVSFMASRSDQRFCSAGCKQRAYRERIAVTNA
jgi:hypothetical protein